MLLLLVIIKHDNRKPFHLLIASGRLENSMIGEMSSNDMAAEPNSSLKHTDLVKKMILADK